MRWKRTHQGIAIAPDGTVLDGQHRLFAVQRSGCTVPMNVSYDYDQEIFTLLDCGVGMSPRKRCPEESWSVSNADGGNDLYRHKDLHPELPLSLKDLDCSCISNPSGESKTPMFSARETMDEAATKVASAHKEFSFLNKGALLALVLMLEDKDESLENVYKFIDKLSAGEGCKPRHHDICLQERLCMKGI